MTAKIPVNNADDAPKLSKDTVYVDVDDDITAIIEKVETAKAKVVALVLPKRATALQSVVNMRLLKRAADNADKNIVLVSTEVSLLPLAGVAGLHVAKNLQAKPAVPVSPGVAVEDGGGDDNETEDVDEEEIDDKDATLDYHRSIGELAGAVALAGDDDETINLADEDAEDEAPAKPTKVEAPKNKKIKVPNFDRFRLLLVGGIALLVALIVFIILAIFVLPKAKVTVDTSSTPVSISLNMTASDQYKALNEAANQIPATLKTTKQTSSQQVPATGQQNNGTKATGSATLTNCSNSSVTVPSGTGVSQGGLTYITQKSITLDSGNFDSHGNCKTSGTHVGSVNITAQTGGTKYNTSFSSGTVAGYPGVSASGSASGGTDNVTTVVSQTDVDNAKQKATAGTSADTFTKQFMQQLSDQGYYVLTSTLKAGDQQTTATPDVGQPASTVNVTVTTTYTVLAVQKADLQKAITDGFNAQIDKTKQRIDTTDVLSTANVSVSNQTATATAAIVVSEDGSAVPIISSDQVKTIAAGKKSGDIQTALSNWPGVKSVTVHLSPFWLSKAPAKTSKIDVVFVRVKGQ